MDQVAHPASRQEADGRLKMLGERQPLAERPRMQLLSWKPVRKGKLFGFARVALPSGLRISDIPIIAGRNGAFAALPAKPQIDAEGRVKRDDRGKALYLPILEWRDRDIAGRFSDTVVALVRTAHPDALDD